LAKGFDDSLQTRAGIQWSKLMVLKSDIAKHWLFTSQTDDADPSWAIRTGAPGRPTPMHLVVAEHGSRLAASKAEMTVTAESEYLARWLKQTHPNLPSLTAKTIRNRISQVHRKACGDEEGPVNYDSGRYSKTSGRFFQSSHVVRGSSGNSFSILFSPPALAFVFSSQARAPPSFTAL
jgi:hypothetical protein